MRNIVMLWLLMALILNKRTIAIRAPCNKLFNKNLKLICTTSYPKLAIQKYTDSYAKPSLIYTVFEIENEKGHYFISHGFSDLKKCLTIKMIEATKFECDSGMTIEIPTALLRCLPFHSSISDDLVEFCAATQYITTIVSSKYTGMHYIDGNTLYNHEKRNSGQSKHLNMIIVYLWILINLYIVI